MYLEESLIAKIRAGRSLGFDLTPDNTPTGFKQSGTFDSHYPPPGYLPFDVLAVGNGDTYGFYWPIGKEDCPPLVLTTMHDAWSVFPVASTFERALRLIHACGLAEGEVEEIAEQFEVDLSGLPSIGDDNSVSLFGKSASALLEIDDSSPSILLAVARTARSAGDLVTAEKFVVRATELLPEYSDAWQLLAELRQQAHNQPGFIDAALRALSSPFSFGARDRGKLLISLQELPDSACAEPHDPIWTRRRSLTFSDNFYESPDLPLLTDAIAEFHSARQYLRAVHLQLLFGDLIDQQDCFLIREYVAGHTTAFQDRSRLPWKGFRADLRQAHIAANLTARLLVV